MSGGLSHVAPYLSYLASALAVVLSVLNLYLARRDRVPRLRIRVRYEYRTGPPPGRPPGSGAAPPGAVHARTQEGLYMRLGDFLKEQRNPARPRGAAGAAGVAPGTPVVRFAVSAVGERTVVLEGVRVVVRAGRTSARPFGRRMVLDPREGWARPTDLAGDTEANLISAGPVEVAPGGGIGYRLGLVRLSEVLLGEGFSGDVRLALEVTDRTGRVHRRPFAVNTDLWASPEG